MLHECRAKHYLLAISDVNSMVHSFLDWTIRRDTIISNNSNFEIRTSPNYAILLVLFQDSKSIYSDVQQ